MTMQNCLNVLINVLNVQWQEIVDSIHLMGVDTMVNCSTNYKIVDWSIRVWFFLVVDVELMTLERKIMENCNECLLNPPRTIDKPSHTSKCLWHEPLSHEAFLKTQTQHIHIYVGEI